MGHSLWEQFSRQAKEYARFRPLYPPELYAYLAQIAPGRICALDCGTGSGQAAVGLAEHFGRVTASDANLRQIGNAFSHPSIVYLVATGEHLPLAAASLDLVAVAQAVHWFDLDAFYRQVKRVLRPGGVIAVWSYYFPESEPAVDAALHHFYFDIVGDYWAPNIRLIEKGYRTLDFPFDELEAPSFSIRAHLGLEDLLGFLESWSAVQHYRQAIGADPIPIARQAIGAAWGDPARRIELTWPIYLRVGRTA
jgi:ubiquinone/menaquinone biosynthesis C-methylase UbiE